MSEQVYLAETRTGRIVAALDGVTGSMGDGLNNQGVTGRFSAPATRTLRAALSVPYRMTIVVAQGDTVISANPVPDAGRSTRGGRADINGGSIWTVLAKRPAWKAGMAPPGEAADLSFRGSLSQIAARLLLNALDWGELPIIVPEVALLPGGDSVRNYPSYEAHDTASRLLNIVDDQGGVLDIHLNPRWKDGAHNAFEWEVRLGEPLSSPGKPWTWDSRSTAVTGVGESIDGGKFATEVWVAGDGSERARPFGHASSGSFDPIDLGAPALHEVLNSAYGSVTERSTLNGYAQAELDEGQALRSTIPVVVEAYPDNAPRLGAWLPGHNCLFQVYDDDWIPDADYGGQILQWSKQLNGSSVSVVTSPLTITQRAPN